MTFLTKKKLFLPLIIAMSLIHFNNTTYAQSTSSALAIGLATQIDPSTLSSTDQGIVSSLNFIIKQEVQFAGPKIQSDSFRAIRLYFYRAESQQVKDLAAYMASLFDPGDVDAFKLDYLDFLAERFQESDVSLEVLDRIYESLERAGFTEDTKNNKLSETIGNIAHKINHHTGKLCHRLIKSLVVQ